VNNARLLGGLALAAMVAGVALTVYGARTTAQRVGHLRAKTESLRRLRELEAGLARDQGAVLFFERLPETRPLPLADVLQGAIPGLRAEIREAKPEPAAQGWTARRAEVMMDNVRLADAARFVLTAENQRPPWRLAECSITGSDRAGYGRVTLVFEALEKGAQ
jgi:hypothetical protein